MVTNYVDWSSFPARFPGNKRLLGYALRGKWRVTIGRIPQGNTPILQDLAHGDVAKSGG